MDNEKRKTPKLRFPQFTDPWEQRKLGEISTRVTRKNKNLESELPLTISAQYGLVDQETFFNKKVAARDVSGYFLLKNGEFAYNKSSSDGYPWGTIKRLDAYEMGVLSTLYICFAINDNVVDSDYLTVFYDTDKWYSDVQARAAEGARNHGLLNIGVDDFFDTGVLMPSTMGEQKAIGSFFTNLDNLITLHQRKLDNMKEYKKGMLQKMFPKDGETVPEIRFPGFTDPWEQRKCKELLVERNEQAPKDEEYPLMAFIADQGVAPKGDKYDRGFLVKDEDTKKYKHTEYGDFIYSSNNLTTGSIGLNQYGKACISPVYSIFYPTELTTSDFIGRLMCRPEFINKMIRTRQGVMYGQWRIHESEFLEIGTLVPSLAEQNKIGALLATLDNLITLHQRKLDQMKEYKSGLLQQMFA